MMVDKMSGDTEDDQYINTSSVLTGLIQVTSLFDLLTSPNIIDKLVNQSLVSTNQKCVHTSLKFINAVLKEYSKDGSNKQINVSSLEEELNTEEPAKTEESEGEAESEEEKAKSEKEQLFLDGVRKILPLVLAIITDKEQIITSSFKEMTSAPADLP